MPCLNVTPLEDAVDVSCFGRACELRVDPPVISASTLEVGFLCLNPAACAARLVNMETLSALAASLTESAFWDAGPWIYIKKVSKRETFHN